MVLSITTLEELRGTVAKWRDAGEEVALVPTMGALHQGHLALMLIARRFAPRVVVSIFVNPTQFGPDEDLSRYPRQLEEDISVLRAAQVEVAWLPTAETMYPHGLVMDKEAGSKGNILEGVHRPGHFNGVLTVVNRLFEQVKPSIALFGEKDYQQLVLIKRLVRNLELPLSILAIPTVREDDGLAFSSRNAYLSEKEREIAPMLYATLQACAAALMMGEDIDGVLAEGKAALLRAGFREVDYLALREEETLDPVRDIHQQPSRLLVAAHLGTTRLIDNLKVA